MKVGCIVNDVASINIDAKLIRNDSSRQGQTSTADLTDTIELANGCACCTIVDELFASFDNLLALADKRDSSYDCIILENSGVAEPQNIRDQFLEAAAMGLPLLNRIKLSSLVTVVDSATFIRDYSTRVPVSAHPELGEGGNLRPVVDLLVEQVECADVVILNKIDMLPSADTADSLAAIIASLNALARVHRCEQGQVPIEELFGTEAQEGLLANLNIEAQHRGAVAAAKAVQDGEEEAEKKGRHEEHKEDCKQCDNGDEHHHHHHHDDDDHKEDCKQCDNGDEHHHHHHHHPHHHHHENENEHKKKNRQATTAAARFGISSFVYSRRRPFHPQRLRDLVLRWMPVSHNKAIGEEEPEAGDSPIRTVLRSKGFMWLANGHNTAFYWSHAGQHFEIRDEGEWWSAVPNDDWPQGESQREIIVGDYNMDGRFGDRRQEIVFIGAGMDRVAIETQMDGALLTDDEMIEYEKQYPDDDPGHPDTPRNKRLKTQSLGADV